MRNSSLYIVFLLAVIGTAVGHVYATSETLTVQVTGKRVEVAQGRKRDFELYVVETDKGSFPILQFPVIGYLWGAKDVHDGIALGETLTIRVGRWPPEIVTEGRPYIMSVN